MQLQQCLPFTVLKHAHQSTLYTLEKINVATVLTVYGIETNDINN